MKMYFCLMILLSSFSSYAKDFSWLTEPSLAFKTKVHYNSVYNKLVAKYDLEPSLASQIAEDMARTEYKNDVEFMREIENDDMETILRKRKESLLKLEKALRKSKELADQY
jgi:hypothetical protein